MPASEGEPVHGGSEEHPGQSGAQPAFVEFVGLLSRSPSGIGFIYHALDLIAARYHLRDAVAVVDSPAAGRQGFRLGRARVQAGPPRSLPGGLVSIDTAEPGLYTDPPVVDRLTSAYVAQLIDVALRLDMLDHAARHDPLTGLLNRRAYESALVDAVGRTRRYGWPFALVLIDLDNFKAVNDQWGHASGDAALRALGMELRAGLRSGDVAARLGGDEFALIVLNADAPDAIPGLLDRLRAALARAVPETQLRFSAGVALFPQEAEDGVTLSKLADERLYAEKTAVS